MGGTIHDTEIPKTTLNGYEPVRAFTFRSVRVNKVPLSQRLQLSNLYDTLLIVINHYVAGPDSKGIC